MGLYRKIPDSPVAKMTSQEPETHDPGAADVIDLTRLAGAVMTSN
jgi:hypothetical protein